MLGQYFVLVTLYHGLQLVLSKTIRIGNTKYFIYTLPTPAGVGHQ